jgi:hypothetical protein
VDHHEAAKNEITFHISRFFGWPSEIERRLRVERLHPADGHQWHHHHHHQRPALESSTAAVMRHDKFPASNVTRLIKFLLVALRFMTPGASPIHQLVVVNVSRLLLSNPAAIDRKIAAAHSPKNTCPVKIEKLD